MKKLITALFLSAVGGFAFGQWSPVNQRKSSVSDPTQLEYKLDIAKIKSQLKNAQETGLGAKPVEIMLPTLRGKIERFAVYSFPVVVKELAEQYDLGSYVGVGIDDPTKSVRFSLAPNNFQSMIIGGSGDYEFIEPLISDKTTYGVHAKTKATGGKSFICSTEEGAAAVKEIEEMAKKGNSFNNQFSDFSKMSDKKYRTMRLAMSVTAEYTTFHGGTVAGALAAINATLTRVNFVFEKDFALHLNLQNFPNVIYTNAATDPYSDGATGSGGAWNAELQSTLTANVGNANYDIGHLFGASGGGGNAGCIGCVCVNPSTPVPNGKGSGYTSPANGIPQGDTFDIDYVAHEMGHQLGANHTFTTGYEGTGVNMEPGSGSTIMGYAGITGANTDVQPNSDAYFHKASITQVQTNLNTKTCDVETTVANDAPVIAALPTYTIPKGTAFVLTASATDAQNDPLTYTWEQVNNITASSQLINKTNLGTTTYGPSFRSIAPTTSPTRYFPKLSSVINGVLDNSNNQWESVSMVARSSKFAVTVRDNHPTTTQQQTQFAEQTITVGDDGPFKLTTGGFLYSTATNTITWDVVNTAGGAYNSPNVKIDYSTDNGATWTALLATTANDGTESVAAFPAALNGQAVALRVSSIGNVFYAVKKMTVAAQATCGTVITGVVVSNITPSSASVNWPAVTGATSYVIRYKKTTDTAWQQTTSTTNSVNISSLTDGTLYEVQVASVCGTQGPFSASVNFTTSTISYCTITATNSPQFEYISNVTLSYNGTTLMTNTSGPSNYTNYTTNTALQSTLAAGNTYGLSITVAAPDWDTSAVFIDFNANGVFESTERVLNYPTAVPTAPITGTFAVPATAVTNIPLRMRVILYYAGATNAGLSLGATFAGCGTFGYGEVEDYNVLVPSLGINETSLVKNNIQIYPNPATDVLNITKVSEKAKFEIHNAVGQLVKAGNISNNQVRVAELVKGTYLITIKDKDIAETVKFIKK
ncbi:propanediol utilization protein [Chryseobacterium sp. Leaf404]|uniref:reprolysin-like metallopeptidase n=1 Tax=unclassified Chryseobacterium TaxID=2593645 RepID=UPI0006F9309A|nr:MULTISPECIES: zinc-dependent metalloprotease family protein [unclassified Chryseobacterium]KQT15329.1 propanediol utilization protein [Chryseobacterium sp. Leaf404]